MYRAYVFCENVIVSTVGSVPTTHLDGQLREIYLKIYVFTLLAFALALVASWVYWYDFAIETRFALGAGAFAVLVLVGDKFPIRVSGNSTIGVWDVGLMAAVATIGPTWAAVAALPMALLAGKRDLLRVAFEVGHSVTIIYMAGAVFLPYVCAFVVGYYDLCNSSCVRNYPCWSDSDSIQQSDHGYLVEDQARPEGSRNLERRYGTVPSF